ncbi:MAG: TIGR02450 family Trp-rich protein [Marinobacter sp.]
MNNFNPKKLLNSKWTAVNPVNKEKHFLVTELEINEEDNVVTEGFHPISPYRAYTKFVPGLRSSTERANARR